MEKKKLLISFSGGRTSAYMTKWLLENKSNEFEIVVVFSNTGMEHEQTLEFVKNCDTFFDFKTIWIEPVVTHIKGVGMRHKIVCFKSASRNGEPFEEVIKKYSLPNRAAPFCSEYMKKNTIRSFAKYHLNWLKKDYVTAIGIRVDEFDRMSVHKQKERLLYPLISMIKTGKQDVNKFWMEQSFDLNLKGYEGNCKTCWKKSMRKLMTIAKESPKDFDWDIQMENKYGNFLPEGRKGNKNIKLPLRLHRGNLSGNDIIELSKQPFEMAIDDSKLISDYKQTELAGLELDVTNGCEESCEAF